MAYRRSGNPPANAQGLPAVRMPQGAPQTTNMDQANYLRRNPSFDHGDDTNGGFQERRYGARAYRASSNAGIQHDELFMGSSNPPVQAPAYSPVPSPGGYLHQEAPIATSNSQSSYNPQHYGQSQAQIAQQPSHTGLNRYSAGYQPYIPAAYQPSTPQYPPTYGSPALNSYPSPPSSQYASQPPPPPPPRPHEQRYGSRVAPQMGNSPPHNYGSENESPYGLPNNASTPTSASLNRTAYTPPAPPPPPFTPSGDTFPFIENPQPHSSNRYSVAQNQQASPDRQSSVNHQLPPLPPRNFPNGNAGILNPPPRSTSYNRLNSSLPPTPGTPGPTPPAHSPQRANTSRHPQARPLPGPPPENDYFSDQYLNDNDPDVYEEEPVYEELMKEVEAAVMGRVPSSSSQRSPRARRNHMHPSIDEGHEPHPLFEEGSTTTINPDTRHTHTNGQLGTLGAGQYINYDAYSDRSDAEAEAGLAAMHMADEQDAADEAYRHSSAEPRQSYGSRHSFGSQRNLHVPDSQPAELSSDSDVAVDVDSYGGGFAGDLHYGAQPLSTHSSQSTRVERDEQYYPGARGSNPDLSALQRAQYEYTMPGQGEIHPFPAFGARVDTGGTGGLSEPGANRRRLSFEDGDEITLADSEGAQTSDTQSPLKEDMHEIYFHPGVSPTRPLPPAPGQLEKGRIPQLMPAGTYRTAGGAQNYDQYGRPTYPAAPNAYDQLLTPSGSIVPRSSSLISHGSTPQTVPPIRSKTDADRAKIVKQQQLAGIRTAPISGVESSLDSALSLPNADLLGLPEIPVGKRRKFTPAKLSTNDFKRCSEPWALCSVVDWVREMSEGTADLRRSMVVDGIVALFTHKVPTMNTADAETLGARVVEAMFDAGTLLKEEEWVKFGEAEISGVLYQLTGTGCYSAKVHTQTLPGRCYAHHCMRTLKKINLQAQSLEPQRKVQDWATFYKISKETIEQSNKKDIERQNILHEIITTEDSYMDQLNVLRVLYRDELNKWQPPILAPKRKDGFLEEVFGRADSIKQVNEDYLLAQLKYRQQEQGPWIVGFSDIFREWVRKARMAYIGYAEDFPKASSLVRQEADRNILFRQFLDQMREHERSKRLGWDTYLKAPITRLQRYGLLLSSVHKNMLQDSEEKQNLQMAIDEIKAVTLECDNKVAEQAKSVTLSELQSKLVLRPGMDKVKLNLTHLGREIIHQGDLQRVGGSRFSWLDIHAILFDHYMVLAKTITQRDAAGGIKYEKYDVSKLVRQALLFIQRQ
ncbi:MAG: hypothetical protein LQ346_007197 [Caloplaca aetnensis]|nr:MAG: hypothetical protein LQ346_007197 [Caloplaca aetnensis]